MAVADDAQREFKELYQPSAKKVQLLDVPAFPFLMIEGVGSPSDAGGDFQKAFAAIFPVVYGMKFGLKKRGGYPEYKVYPPEALWGTESGPILDLARPETWRWTLMIRQPEWVTPELVEEFRGLAAAKKNASRLLGRVKLESFREGLCVQTMHVGPYDAEKATIDRMLAFAAENGCEAVPDGRHHEIYISDPSRTAPERMKTALRIPVRRV